jgi:hypothetical protein
LLGTWSSKYFLSYVCIVAGAREQLIAGWKKWIAEKAPSTDTTGAESADGFQGDGPSIVMLRDDD